MSNNENLIPIWHKPAWVTTIVGLVSVFLTIPEVIVEYYKKEQEVEIAKQRKEEIRLGNLESKQDQEFKVIQNTLSQHGAERIFVLRYLAATLDDDDAKEWANNEVTRLDEISSKQEIVQQTHNELLGKEILLKSNANNEKSKLLETELLKLNEELDKKLSELSKLKQKAGLITATNNLPTHSSQCETYFGNRVYTKSDGYIEAEDIYCNEYWKLWSKKEFSGRYLVSNESTSPGLAFANSAISLRFKGTGLKVIYRQDTWYGDLVVEIDGTINSIIDQSGAIKNQKSYIIEGLADDNHILRLIGSRRTGVVTIDAIEIH